MARRKQVTLSTIAEKAGVSRQVVSAVLKSDQKGNVRYSRETCDRVMTVIQDLGYRPNRTATSLVQKRHGALGILIHQTGNIPSSTLQYILEASKEHRQIITIESFNPDQDELPLFIREDSVDGIIVFENIPDRITGKIEELQIPVVYVNNNKTGSPHSITFDEEGAMEMAVEYCISRHRSRFGIVLPEQDDHYSVTSRHRGLTEALQRRGIGTPAVYRDSPNNSSANNSDDTLDSMVHFLSSRKLDAVILYSDHQSPLIFQAASQLGMDIPGDLHVVAVNFTRLWKDLLPRISILRINPQELGTKIVQILNEKIEGTYIGDSPVVLEYQLLTGKFN